MIPLPFGDSYFIYFENASAFYDVVYKRIAAKAKEAEYFEKEEKEQ